MKQNFKEQKQEERLQWLTTWWWHKKQKKGRKKHADVSIVMKSLLTHWKMCIKQKTVSMDLFEQ